MIEVLLREGLAQCGAAARGGRVGSRTCLRLRTALRARRNGFEAVLLTSPFRRPAYSMRQGQHQDAVEGEAPSLLSELERDVPLAISPAWSTFSTTWLRGAVMLLRLVKLFRRLG